MAPSDPIVSTNVSKSQLKSGLTLLATPIGNSRDVTLRTLDALRDADAIACEDTRMARRLMDLHGIPLGSRPLIAYHEHNAGQATPRLMALIEGGARVVYLSDAGTPIVADPGYRLAKAVIEKGEALSATPGPCAVHFWRVFPKPQRATPEFLPRIRKSLGNVDFLRVAAPSGGVVGGYGGGVWSARGGCCTGVVEGFRGSTAGEPERTRSALCGGRRAERRGCGVGGTRRKYTAECGSLG